MKNRVILTVWAVVAILCELVHCLGFCGFPCGFSNQNPVCGSDGVTYSSFCQLIRERDCNKPDLSVKRHGKCFTTAQKAGIGIGASIGIIIFICGIPCGIIMYGWRQARTSRDALSPSVWPPGSSVSRQSNNAFHPHGARYQNSSHVNAQAHSTGSGIPMSMVTLADSPPETHANSFHIVAFPGANMDRTTAGPVPDGETQVPPPYFNVTARATAVTHSSQSSAPADEDDSLPSYEDVMKTHSRQV